MGPEIPILSTGQLGSVTSDKEWKLCNIDYYKLHLFLSTPILLNMFGFFPAENMSITEAQPHH